MTDAEMIKLKQEIDAMDYESMLRKWRYASLGSPYFQGEIGAYYSKRMAEKRTDVGDAAHTAASKSIGWDSKP